jgi:hypothetical protein
MKSRAAEFRRAVDTIIGDNGDGLFCEGRMERGEALRVRSQGQHNPFAALAGSESSPIFVGGGGGMHSGSSQQQAAAVVVVVVAAAPPRLFRRQRWAKARSAATSPW